MEDLFSDQDLPSDHPNLYGVLIEALGYADSRLFCEDEGIGLLTPPDRHWIRAARKAGARGTYFFRTSPTTFRPAVHVAEARTQEEARNIHRRLWNQGINPFLIVVLPAEIRVLSGFAFHPTKPEVGRIKQLQSRGNTTVLIAETLSELSSGAIDRGDIWQSHERHLGVDKRVDTTLLANLQALSVVLQQEHGLSDKTSHALIGKFVYLAYLRARDILSDKWLQNEAGLAPESVFSGETFSSGVTLQSFRTLVRALEKRFNGHLFPIPWGGRHAPRKEAIRTVARVFSGDDPASGQIHLPFAAYDFEFIPVELLSAIYEQFLHAEGSDTFPNVKEVGNPEKQGAHYTPEPLADYLVSEVDSVRPLKTGMKILDPCCGSGVFLVVAFRRLVELECEHQQRTSLPAGELKRLLETSIYGVERNETACRIAGFSLLLALLSYVEPPELHRRKNFKFPRLVGSNLFVQDFFDPAGPFWQRAAPQRRDRLTFDWILGNPPWVELESGDPKAKLALEWLGEHKDEYGLARARTGEAFAWRIMDCLAQHGAAGLILHAKSLTNDQLAPWRRKFFGGVQVHRITNFANLAYVLFASAQQPAATIIYTRKPPSSPLTPVLHIGPFVAHQTSLALRKRTKRRAWAIGFSESEIKCIPASDAAQGDAATWKFALWGNQRDAMAIRRLRRIFSTSLGSLAESRDWTISLGLQLRAAPGTEKDPSEYRAELEGLSVLNHRALIESGGMLRIQNQFLESNQQGCFVRKGRIAGLALTSGPRLFLWNDFAAYTIDDFIIRHDKLGLAGESSREMKAVAAIWNSNYIRYLLFFVTSAAWGIAYSQIDKGDAENLPFPELTQECEEGLAASWEKAEKLQAEGAPFDTIREFLDQRVAALLGIPDHVSLIVSDFFRVRYQLNKGKTPPDLVTSPSDADLRAYAFRLRKELDTFLGDAGRHKVTILYSPHGVSASVTLTGPGSEIEPDVHPAAADESSKLQSLLQAAEERFSQWTYIKKSLRIFDGNTIHLLKPPRRLEWTETQALLDADDIIAEVLEARTSREGDDVGSQ